MQEVKCIATDLDGTFLTNQKTISPRNRQAIQACKEKGILFGIATGRPTETTQKMVKKWNLEKEVDFIMGMNGGLIYDCHTEKMEQFHPLDGSTIQEIIRFFEGTKAIFHVKMGLDRYTNFSNETTRKDAKRFGENEIQVDLIPFLEGKKVAKLNVVSDPKDQGKVIERANAFKALHPEVVGFPTQAYIYEFVDYRINKGFGLKKVADHYGIGMENTLAFGDAENDLKLLEAAGCGVAMKNGAKIVKANANVVFPFTNQEDAVARYLEEHVL